MTLIFLYEKSKTLKSIFSQIEASIWMQFSMLPQPVGLLKLMLHLLWHVIEKREIPAEVIYETWRDDKHY